MAKFYASIGLPNLEKRPIVEEVRSYVAAKKKEDEKDETVPTLLKIRDEIIHLMKPIGVGKAHWCNKVVYRGVYEVDYDSDSEYDVVGKIPGMSQDVLCDVVIGDGDNADFKEAVEKNRAIPSHINLLRVREPVMWIGGDLKEYYSIDMPFMDKGSFRTIMFRRFPDGVPEACVLLALFEALKGLSVIHECGQLHKDISAGHILVSARPEIRLAYFGSVYDLCEDEDEDASCHVLGFMRAAEICKWAAAPEVYRSEDSTEEEGVYTPKSDMWLIGITALELAYGGLKVHSRAELIAMVLKINKKKRLPPKKGRKFSKGFEKLVTRCLELNQDKRPTADQLMLDGVFDGVNYDVFYSYKLFNSVI